jgi:adenine-specific DNA-methyltransferase
MAKRPATPLATPIEHWYYGGEISPSLPVQAAISGKINAVTARYQNIGSKKSEGATYTPGILADFVAKQILDVFKPGYDEPIRLLDPAVGDGELLHSLLRHIDPSLLPRIRVVGYDINSESVDIAHQRLNKAFPGVDIEMRNHNFLDVVLRDYAIGGIPDLFSKHEPELFDLVIANPPYVRTQILGAGEAQRLSRAFGLAGRVDLYYAFLLSISSVLSKDAVAGIIVSNRFMTTKSGSPIRDSLLRLYNILHIWDFGDTRLFDAAVLPAVLLLSSSRPNSTRQTTRFSSSYQTESHPTSHASNVIEAMYGEGVVGLADGRTLKIEHGELATSTARDVWAVSTSLKSDWLKTVANNTWATFGDIGKIRVGVKTCADKVFIRSDWMTRFSDNERPELLRHLTTHHIAGRFHCNSKKMGRMILYPHSTVCERRRVVDIEQYPNARAYLESARDILQKRKYVIESGREWYEIWVPQDPSAWEKPKLIFRDISAEPTFWLDFDGTVVNGDCYWLVPSCANDCNLLWLAAGVANSSFIEQFYDLSFNNKLYAGRRRYITQYVEKFPLPNPESLDGMAIIELVKQIYDEIASGNAYDNELYSALDDRVWKAFGLSGKEILG